MSNILSFVSPLEFLLRYTVITGLALAIIGTSILFMAKSIVKAKHNTDTVSKNDKLYLALLFTGIAFILIGMIVMALPINNTFYRV